MLDAPEINRDLEKRLESRGYGLVKFAGGETPAEFFLKPKEQAPVDGVRQFKDVPAIRFYLAGGGTHEAWATDEHKMRYPRQWAQFQNNQEQVAEGLPLEHWVGITPAQIATFKHQNIKTVQQLAHAPQPTIQSCGMGAVALQNKAKEFLKGAAGQQGVNELVKDNERLRCEVDLMKKQMAELISKLSGADAVGGPSMGIMPGDAEEAVTGPKRGRRTKDTE